MKNEVEEALSELVDAEKESTPRCWASKISDEAKEFLYSIEQFEMEGKSIPRKKAAAKFNELFDLYREITGTMISNHLVKSCTCSRFRDYGWPEKK